MGDTPSLSLNLTDTVARPISRFAPQPIPRNSAVAFLLSLVFPGAGHLYCGKTSRALWISGFFLPLLAATTYLTIQLGGTEGRVYGMFWGILFRTMLFLYIFAFLDAFLTAREMTIGTDAFIAESPRVAALLNLLTRGFGYFYLGKRTLGFAVFLGLGFFQRAVLQGMHNPTSAVVAILLEIIQMGLAVHAYSIGRQREKAILATVDLPTIPQVSLGLPVAIPYALALLLAAGYFALSAVGVSLPDYANVAQSSVSLTQDARGSAYVNPKYGVTLRVPDSWTITYQEPRYFVLASRSDNACSVDFRPLAWGPLLGLDAYQGQLMYGFSKEKNSTGRILAKQSVFLSGLPAQDLTLAVTEGAIHLTEHHIVGRKGLTLYDFGTYALADDDSCTSDLRFIRENLVLPH